MDDGSGLNIFPLSTMRHLRFDLRNLKKNQVNVREKDGVQRNTLGVMNFVIQMGSVEFKAEFHMVDI